MKTISHEWIASAQRLTAQGRPFALVSVVRVEAPASARPGDKALVTEDGRIDGWIGGGCAQPIVLRTVRDALLDGRARLVRITPAAEGHEHELGDVLEFGMACHSGGTIELFVDPVLPPDRLVVIGDSPVARSLSELAPRVGLAVTVIAQGAEPARYPDAERVLDSDDATAAVGAVGRGAFVVVATQGRRDLQGLCAALALRARTIFFVASARKADVLRGALIELGQPAVDVAAIVSPAGQSIGARTPEEIALSVLATVVAARHTGAANAPVSVPPSLSVSSDPPVAARACCGSAATAA